MADTALFLGWGGTYPGRERLARETYTELVDVLNRLKAEGEIEGFETVLLAPHGGELDGFMLVYGEPDKLATLQMRDALNRVQMRARLDHAKFSVIWAVTGDEVKAEFELLDEVVEHYEREAQLA